MYLNVLYTVYLTISFLHLQNISTQWVNDNKTTTEKFVRSIDTDPVSALTIVLLGMFMEINITVLTATREWTLWPSEPENVVIGYNGPGRFLSSVRVDFSK